LRAELSSLGVDGLALPVADAARAYDEHRIDGFISPASVALAFQWSAMTRFVTDLRIDWSRAGDPAALEQRMRLDPAILVADRMLGSSDYRLFSRHCDYRAANDWIRRFAADPAIGQMTTRFCTGLQGRPRHAAARLANRPGGSVREGPES